MTESAIPCSHCQCLNSLGMALGTIGNSKVVDSPVSVHEALRTVMMRSMTMTLRVLGAHVFG